MRGATEAADAVSRKASTAGDRGKVGVLRRIVVIDTNFEEPEPIVLVNPEILETEGEQTGDEGCLSLPGKSGTVTRPMKVKVKACDINMQPFEIEGEGLLARAICHECDHLDGVVYTSKVEGELHDTVYADDEEAEEETE